MAEACLACDTINTPADANIPGPFGTKYDDHEDSVEVTVVIPGVKRGRFFGLLGKSNAGVEFTCKEQSLRLYVEVKGKKQKKSTHPEKCLYLVKKLPEKVVPDKSSYHIQDDKVLVILHKEVPGSWKNTLDTYGLETAVE